MMDMLEANLVREAPLRLHRGGSQFISDFLRVTRQ